MKTAIISLIATFFVFLAIISFVRPLIFPESVRLIILDTDISSDVDDVGAVAVLHALANQGKVQILAMMISSGDPWSAPCLDALNTWFGRPNIPIGIIKGKSVRHESKYTEAIATEFPQDLKTGESAPDAVTLYRRILSQQEDKSVFIVTIGYLTNLTNLLQSQADEVSPLNGQELVRRKVQRLICMGGQYPDGREWNFYQDTPAAEFVLKEWSTSITFCGFEVGQNIMTGRVLRTLPVFHPVRRSYFLYNNITDRPSWDQLSVFYAVEGNTDVSGISWNLSPQGDNVIDSTGFNKWIANPNALNNYLGLEISPQRAAEVINRLMLDPASR